MFRTMISRAVFGAALAFATPAFATDFDFSNYSQATKTVDGITVTATAWSIPIGDTGLPSTASLGRWEKGFGVTNANEGDGSYRNSHTIDNVGSYDFVKLTFSKAVSLTGITRNGFSVDGSGLADTDAWVSYGSTAFDTSARWQGYLDRGKPVDGADSFSSSNIGTVWLVGASRANVDRADGFKLGGVSAVAAVPEPATWAMMIGGFGLAGTAMRRRRRSNAAFA